MKILNSPIKNNINDLGCCSRFKSKIGKLLNGVLLILSPDLFQFNRNTKRLLDGFQVLLNQNSNSYIHSENWEPFTIEV